LISLIPLFIMGGFFYWPYFLLLTVTGLISVKYKLLFKTTTLHWALIRARVFRRKDYQKMIRAYVKISNIVLAK